MAKKKVAMQLFPMVEGDFDLEPFWKSVSELAAERSFVALPD